MKKQNNHLSKTIKSAADGNAKYLFGVACLIAFTLVLIIMFMPEIHKVSPKAKEAVLRENLFRVREVIAQYYKDQCHYPQSLEILVSEGYLRKIPVDAITRSSSTWQLIYEMETNAQDPAIPKGIYNVKSGAFGTSLDGIPYSNF